eukprot:357120-Chlamydomonas_euryale.AAC.2
MAGRNVVAWVLMLALRKPSRRPSQRDAKLRAFVPGPRRGAHRVRLVLRVMRRGLHGGLVHRCQES